MINSRSVPPVSPQASARRLRLVDNLEAGTGEDCIGEDDIERRPSSLVGILVLVIAGCFAVFTGVPAASWICLGIVGVLFVAHSNESNSEAASNAQ